jgi:hypothetical protein
MLDLLAKEDLLVELGLSLPHRRVNKQIIILY